MNDKQPELTDLTEQTLQDELDELKERFDIFEEHVTAMMMLMIRGEK